MSATSKSNAFGYGVATIASDGTTLDTLFLSFGLGSLSSASRPDFSGLLESDPVRMISRREVSIEIDLGSAPVDVPDVYLRLHLLSNRYVRPHGLSLEGVFSILPNVIWTAHGPCSISNFQIVRAQLLRTYGLVNVLGVDKFPRMVDYVIPDGVRIADADRVRLGAHLATGTTVMHEGFVNFNAGTLGKSMVEGRISAGVIVGDGSDIGGGASIMGTLSGGGKEIISVGERTLLGANSGIGISLGNDCVVEAGLYLTAGTKVSLPDGTSVAAREISGANGLLFRRNSRTGAVEALPRKGSWGGLNSVLHAKQ